MLSPLGKFRRTAVDDQSLCRRPFLCLGGGKHSTDEKAVAKGCHLIRRQEHGSPARQEAHEEGLLLRRLHFVAPERHRASDIDIREKQAVQITEHSNTLGAKVIGRAHRIGRRTSLTVTRLLYDGERA